MLDWLFSTDFAARSNGACSGWTHAMAVADAIGEALVWGAYMAIPALMLRSRMIVSSTLTALFAAFILACGVRHGLSAVTNFVPLYNFGTAWTYVLAAVSWATVVAGAHYVREYRMVHRVQYEELVDRLEKAREKIASLEAAKGAT